MAVKAIISIFLLGASIYSVQGSAASAPKQIALNASSRMYFVYEQSGISGVIAEIKTCYDSIKNNEQYLNCAAMDIQAMRLDFGLSKKRAEPVQEYFSEAQMDERMALIQRWYPSKSQRDYAINELLNGLDQGAADQVKRLEQGSK